MHGEVRLYRGAARAARSYLERDRSRADDYYLTEGSGVALRMVAAPGSPSGRSGEAESAAGALGGHLRTPTGDCNRDVRPTNEAFAQVTRIPRWSRLSESNRRPIHYE